MKRVPQLTVAFCAAVLLSCFPTKPVDPTLANNPVDIKDDTTSDLPTDVATNANVSEAGIDSMFALLIARVESMDSAQSQHDVYAIDFESLRKGFGAAVVKTPSHGKANVGYIVSTMLALNTSSSIQKLIDSLDIYIQGWDDYNYSEPVPPKPPTMAKRSSLLSVGLLHRTFKRQGLTGIGRVLLAKSPAVLLAAAPRPSFPRFITASYIQGILKNDVLPRLGEVLACTRRLENSPSMSIMMTTFDETFELDQGDMWIFESGVCATRAMLSMFCIYDMDIYSSDGANTMGWIDQLYDAAEHTRSQVTYSLSDDTLVETNCIDSRPYAGIMADIYSYNLNRSGFMSIKTDYFTAAWDDLKRIPVAIKTGLSVIESETDNQDNDIFPAGDIFDMKEEMATFSSDMLDEGFSPALAAKFGSPATLADFIAELLTSPYVFNETIEGYPIAIKVDLSKFFTNPPTNLKNWLPKYRLLTGDARTITYTIPTSSDNNFFYEQNSFSYYPDSDDSVIVNIPAALIDSTRTSDWGSTVVFLKRPCMLRQLRETMVTCQPYALIDDAGRDIPSNDLIAMFDDPAAFERAFPYFRDYTFGGIFPDMSTRRKWVDLFVQFVGK
jgi:hypothetical protein